MKPENLNNLSQKPRGSFDDSTTENNSPSSDSDIEGISCETSDQKKIVQGLKKNVRRNKTKINDLVAKLSIAEMHLASEKEKSNYKDDVIKSLHLSIDLVNQTKELSIQKMESQIADLQNVLDLSKSNILIKDMETSGLLESLDHYKKEIDDSNAEIVKLKCEVQEKDNKCVELDEKNHKYKNLLKEKEDIITKLQLELVNLECKFQEKDDKLEEMEKKWAELPVDDENTSESILLLNCTEIPSIKYVTPPGSKPFAAIFEDIPSAGPGWMVIQRRFDGSVNINTNSSFYYGHGDLSGEFWIGCEKLHYLTASRRHELYIELVDFDNVTAFARYDDFVVGGEYAEFRLTSLGKYTGNAGDALRSHIYEGSYCYDPKKFHSGWWGTNDCNLNGKYHGSKIELDTSNGIWWGSWNMGKRYSLKSCKMLIRPKPIIKYRPGCLQS
ncbi:fibrinogen-like protein 1 [Drosophila rhopaloa]|uniref:Fibrinogen-like protein 1 n=1 Tax=Drosophila rhopaloa TaxID=1041015 RepID=A0A6P4EF47_DRORH|nr:fibrinogen-like protein 1 [Drosophila rhopaloa]